MNQIQKIVDALDAEMTRVYEEYTVLHRELDDHRGRVIEDTNLHEVNRLLKEIQEKFAVVYPAYHFIASRYQYACNAVNSYNEFIESLKKAGAQQNEKIDS